jgi:hypothetical protein
MPAPMIWYCRSARSHGEPGDSISPGSPQQQLSQSKSQKPSSDGLRLLLNGSFYLLQNSAILKVTFGIFHPGCYELGIHGHTQVVIVEL